MAKLYTQVVGVALLLVGILGFTPLTSEADAEGTQVLLGFININVEQSLIHILTGVVALAALASAREAYLSAYVKVFGVVYALVAVWGLPALAGADYNGVLFGLIHVNWATELVHILIAAFGLYIGFAGGAKKAVATS